MLLRDGQYSVWCRLAAFSNAPSLVCPIVGHRTADEVGSIGVGLQHLVMRRLWYVW
jgi:hypothetical protein